MPKVIHPRRHDKDLTVQQFWTIKNQNKLIVESRRTCQAFKEDIIDKRHRYQRPSQVAKQFNPLSYFLNNNFNENRQHNNFIVDENQNTYTTTCLRDAGFRVSSPLVIVKKMTNGLKSIIHNQEKIFEVLWRNLQCEDSWPLLQAVLKDTQGSAVQIWLNSGLRYIAQGINNITGTKFNQHLFTSLFKTICIFVEFSFDNLVLNIKLFFTVFAQQFMKHQNKYIRKFSLQIMSYILTNLSDQQYDKFLHYLLQLQIQQFFDQKLKLPVLLVQRLKVVKGCFTTSGLTQIFKQLQYITTKIQATNENKQVLIDLGANYVYEALCLLNNRFGAQSNQILFDFKYVINGLIGWVNKNSSLNSPLIIKGFSQFMALFQEQPSKFQANTQGEARYISQIWNIFADFFLLHHLQFEISHQIDLSLALLLTRSNLRIYNNKNIIKYFQQRLQAFDVLVRLIFEDNKEVTKDLLQVLLMLSKETILEFWTKGSHYQLIYLLLLILKRNKFQRLIQNSWLNLQQNDILTKLKQFKIQNQLLVALRFLSIFNWKVSVSSIFLQKIIEFQHNLLHPYENYLQAIILSQKINWIQASTKYFYNPDYLARQIIIFSHHEIPWLTHFYNLTESFNILIQNMRNRSSLPAQKIIMPHWYQLIINRSSTLQYFEQSNSKIENKMILNLIGSRSRVVRQKAIEYAIKLYEHQENGQQMNILRIILQIDYSQINLDNQRQIKRLFEKLQDQLAVFDKQPVSKITFIYQLLLQWSIGFAFTGFQLIERSFISFFSSLLNYQLASKQGVNISEQIIMPFLRYYQYRHSRRYDFDLSTFSPHKHLINYFDLAISDSVKILAQEDFGLLNLNTIEWIGVERIAQAIRISKKAKQNIGTSLQRLVDTYFSQQFKRQKQLIHDSSQGLTNNNPLLLPIKSRFLGVILKLCTEDFLPPFECLHFVKNQFFELKRIKMIKRNCWEKIWEKKQKEGKKKRDVQQTGTDINFQRLSADQQLLYLHYLWKQLLQANSERKRVIVEHIRNQMPTVSIQLFNIFSQSICQEDLKLNKQSVITLSQRLLLLNRKNLLTHIFILKPMLSVLKREAVFHIDYIIIFVLALTEIVYTNNQSEQQIEVQEKQQQKEQDQKKENIQDINSQKDQDQQIEGKKNRFSPYKMHRKELLKLLQVLFTHQQFESNNLAYILQTLLINSRVNLARSTRSSVPGLLLIINMISQHKQYIPLLFEISQGTILHMLCSVVDSNYHQRRPIKLCFDIWLNIMVGILLVDDSMMEDEDLFNKKQIVQINIDKMMKKYASYFLKAILSYLNCQSEVKISSNKKQKNNEQHLKLLSIIYKLFILSDCENEEGWGQYIFNEISKLAKIRHSLNDYHCRKLQLLLSILTRYLQLQEQSKAITYLRKTMTLLPLIKDIKQRSVIIQIICKAHNQLGLGNKIVELAQKTCQVVQTGLQINLNYSLFFQSCNAYCQLTSSFSPIQHQYFIYHTLCYIDHDQLSVRRMVTHCSKSLLDHYRQIIKNPATQNQSKRIIIELVVRIYRATLEIFNSISIQQNQTLFWGLVQNLQNYYKWFSLSSIIITQICHSSKVECYSCLDSGQDQDQHFLKLLSSISDSQKLKGLKTIQEILKTITKQQKKMILSQQQGFQIPNPLHRIILPILEFFILQPTQRDQNAPKNNLSSSLALSALETLPILVQLLKESIVKKTLKRLLSKLKMNDSQIKRNISIIKMISQIIEGVPGLKANQLLKNFIRQHGFQGFYQKLKEQSQQYQSESNDSESEEEPEKIGYFDKLEQLQSQEAIQRNFMSFDKKLLQIQEEGNSQNNSFSSFLRKHLLPPLRAMLMMENRSKEKEDTSKAKLLLSLATTKVLLRLSLDTFLRQFQKIVGKLSRLLKKNHLQARQNARGCLCQISKAVGPQLLYTIIMTLKANLRDNFDSHVLNFTIFKILDSTKLGVGDLDYCIPLILPLVVDQVFGRSAHEKELVDKGEVPTLKMEARKRKGLELLQILCKHLSLNKITYTINYLQKFLSETLVSEQNLGKYDQMLGTFSGGLSANPHLNNSQSAIQIIPSLAMPIEEFRKQIKWTRADNNQPKHENTVKKGWIKHKAGKQQILTLQQAAGRNKSIFGTLAKQINQKRNKQILTNALTQFYLMVVSLLVRKQVITINSVTITPDLAQQTSTLLSFLVDCIDHRDNRLVSKSLKILHIALFWKAQHISSSSKSFVDKLKILKKQASRKILLLIEQLTLSDEQLLRQSFLFLNDMVSSISINAEILPNLVAVIKMHTPTTQQQPNIPETYRLLQTILIKAPTYLYHPLIQELHQLIQLQVVTCRNRDIKEICQSILGLYLRQNQALQPSIDAYNISQKQNKKIISYDLLIKEQLNFHLSHLQTEAQPLILQLISSFVEHCNKQNMQKYAELLLLSIITARTNQIIQQSSLNSGKHQSQHPADLVIKKILSKIDLGKIISLLQKCLTWMKGERHSSIRLCGFSFLRIILSEHFSQLGKAFINKYILNSQGCIQIINNILKEQIDAFELYSDLQKIQGKIDQQWNKIIHNMQESSPSYQIQLSLFEAIKILKILSSQHLKTTQFIHSIIKSIWQLLLHKQCSLVQQLIDILKDYTITSSILQYIQDSQSKSGRYSARKIVSTLLFREIEQNKLQKLVTKIVIQDIQIFHDSLPSFKAILWLLIGLALKAHIKPKAYQRVLPIILHLINQVLFSQQVGNNECRQIAFSQPNLKNKLVELTLKLTSNELIQHESKSLIQHTSQILKQELGVTEYFRAVSEFEDKKRKGKVEQKLRIAELAILDPEQYASQKRRKKRKTE